MDTLLTPTITSQICQYINWMDLKNLEDVISDREWGNLIDMFVDDSVFKMKFEPYAIGNGFVRSYRNSFLYFINWLMGQPPKEIPKILWRDKAFVICYGKRWNVLPYLDDKMRRDSDIIENMAFGDKDILQYLSEDMKKIGI